MAFLSDLKMYSRFAWGLRGFLKQTLTLEEAKAIVKKRMEEREDNFLRLLKKGIFGYPKSPYLPLLKLTGCEYGDIKKMTKDKGLEGALNTLREAGVYITFEEFKGSEPIVRNGKVFNVKEHDFDNPFLRHYYQSESGGSTGVGTRVAMDLDHLAAHAPCLLLTQHAHGVLNVPIAIWFGILPDPAGLNSILRRVPFRNIPRKWFLYITRQDYRPPLKNFLATYYIIVMGRIFGAPLPWPEAVPLDQAIVIARWAAEMLKIDGACLIPTHVSRALRICLAAQENGLDLTGLTFMISGEPPTPMKIKGITQTGAKFIPSYHFVEAGMVGQGCTRPSDINDIHLFKDTLALIQHSRGVPGSELMVDAFLFTSLLPTAPKLLVNVESDDYGVIETRSCGCPFESYGFTEHLRNIHSFRKLTGEGVTLVGSEILPIIEEVLPSRFGGSPLDYQLMEEEDEQGFTRLSLLVSPKIEISDEAEVIKAVLESLGQISTAADLARAIWDQAKTLRIKRMEPIWTERGKLMPLHLDKRSGVPSKDQ